MSKEKNHVTETELTVLEVLWDEGSATIRTITDTLYPEGGASHYATVQKLLERLEAKKFVRRDRKHIPHRFKARVTREKLISSRLRDLADSLCGGSLSPLLTHLVESSRLSEAEIALLRKLVASKSRRGGED